MLKMERKRRSDKHGFKRLRENNYEGCWKCYEAFFGGIQMNNLSNTDERV